MSDRYVAYVGSYTRGKSKGLSIYDVDENFNFTQRVVYEINNPSHLILSYNEKFLYTSCDEGVAAFRALDNGGLELINKAPVNGLRPCYLAVDKKNKYLVTAGYHDGKMTVLRLHKDGSIGEVTDEVFMTGLGQDAGRHYLCHVNCALFSPDEHFIFSIDIGMDQVKTYEFDHRSGKIKLHEILRCDLGSAPKHMIFSKDGKYAYLTFENSNVVKQYAYDSKDGKFTELQSLSTLPPKYNGFSNAVTLKLTPDDKYLYVTNSGADSVAIYEINPETKVMENICILPVSGEYPKDILIGPDGKSFLCVNQLSDSMTLFCVDYKKKYFYMHRNPVKIFSPTSVKLKKVL